MTSLDFFYDESTITFLQNCSDYIADIGCIRVYFFFFFCTLSILICSSWNIPTGTYILEFSNKTIDKMHLMYTKVTSKTSKLHQLKTLVDLEGIQHLEQDLIDAIVVRELVFV